MSTQRPSYILFITDQQRVDYLGCYGHPASAPHIDAMASEGVRFEQFYVAAPVCMPNRASLMTCRMPTSHGVRSLGIPLDMDQVIRRGHAGGGLRHRPDREKHLQNVSNFPTQYERKPLREGFTPPPPELRDAIRSDLDSAEFQYERPGYWKNEDARSPSPFYGFDHYDCAAPRHQHRRRLRTVAATGRAGSTRAAWPGSPVPPRLHRAAGRPDKGAGGVLFHNLHRQSGLHVAGGPRGAGPTVLPDGILPDPHHPFNPPGKYWDMYQPEDMEIPRAFTDNDWVMPDYIRLAEEARAEDPTLGQKMGYSLAISAREAQEARALTCGMITMVDDAIGRVREAADQGGTGR